MTIFKMYDGRHIDLSKIVSVGPMSVNGTWEFWVWFQLMDRPMQFIKRAFSETEIDEVDNAARRAASEAKGQVMNYSDMCRFVKNACRLTRNEIENTHKEEFLNGHAALMTAWRDHVEKSA